MNRIFLLALAVAVVALATPAFSQDTTVSPTVSPTTSPTTLPTTLPTKMPTANPTPQPTMSSPTKMPTANPTTLPTTLPTKMPTSAPTPSPTRSNYKKILEVGSPSDTIDVTINADAENLENSNFTSALTLECKLVAGIEDINITFSAGSIIIHIETSGNTAQTQLQQVVDNMNNETQLTFEWESGSGIISSSFNIEKVSIDAAPTSTPTPSPTASPTEKIFGQVGSASASWVIALSVAIPLLVVVIIAIVVFYVLGHRRQTQTVAPLVQSSFA